MSGWVEGAQRTFQDNISEQTNLCSEYPDLYAHYDLQKLSKVRDIIIRGQTVESQMPSEMCFKPFQKSIGAFEGLE